jgi:hypothetical protein
MVKHTRQGIVTVFGSVCMENGTHADADADITRGW